MAAIIEQIMFLRRDILFHIEHLNLFGRSLQKKAFDLDIDQFSLAFHP